MAESIRIEVDNPMIDFVMGGQPLASFPFFDLETELDSYFSRTKDGSDESVNAGLEHLKAWMVSRGLPEHINMKTVEYWVNAYVAKAGEVRKKIIGQ